MVLKNLDRIMQTWKGCYDQLLNEGNPFDRGMPNEG